MLDAEYLLTRARDFEHLSLSVFKVRLKIKTIIASDVLVDENVYLSVFLSSDDFIYALYEAPTTITLRDVQRISKELRLKVHGYHAPDGNKEYFATWGKKLYEQAFPGRRVTSRQDISYYQTLSPYSPALIRLASFDGYITRFNPSSHTRQRDFNEITTKTLQAFRDHYSINSRNKSYDTIKVV